ncbi:MAG: 3-hydroxyanthranilate 3,4-dioxygenase [Bacteroidetes bacterium]|nr:3-hydroxyanthranilate 3,4-dioxygenase [Bacteroidota bacterium]MBL6962522.1 3-hydroxyanthranilate 3,4-dioxygenase [Bacteroidota bacterium]
MTKLFQPVHFKKWIDDNRHLLKPPVGNKCVYEDGEFIIMVVGGPNSRKDYHYNETPEFYFQIEGDIVLTIQNEGKAENIPIKEGEIYLLPSKVPHSPQRGKDTIGLVVEYKRPEGMLDGLQWYCEKCNHKLNEEKFKLDNIETDMPVIFKAYYNNKEKCTCDNCGHYMTPPEKAF